MQGERCFGDPRVVHYVEETKGRSTRGDSIAEQQTRVYRRSQQNSCE